MSAYPYLDVPHLHFQLGEDIAVVSEYSVSPHLVAAVLVVVLAGGMALPIAHVVIVVALGKKKDTLLV